MNQEEEKPEKTKVKSKLITEVLSKKTIMTINHLKELKSFDGTGLDKIENVHPKSMRRVCATNYKLVSVMRCEDKFTYLVSISRKGFKWWCSFQDVVEAAKAGDKKLLEKGFKPANFKYKKKAA